MTGQTTSKPTCPSCGAEIPPDAPQGFCLKCLFALGTAEPADQSAIRNPQSAIGSRSFGDYELLEEIARGGMGIIYKARQKSLGRIVAVKMLLFGDQSGKEQAQRFRAEAALAASLQHPNIVAIHEVSAHEGQPFFVMDFIEGQNLARLSAECEVRNVEWLRRAARYVKIVAEAIHYAHERGILHRDLKPSNVLIDPFDQPRVTDFGLAKNLHHDSELTLSGQVLGSPNYMPPEQAAAKRGLVGRRSDVYSLGAILYHLLTGRPPFVGETLTDTLQNVVNNEPVSPRLLNPSVPRDLETLCLKCLEKEPARRYQTAQALAEELDRFLRNEPIQARPISPVGKLWRWCRRKPALAGLIVALHVVLAIGLAGILWEWQRAQKGEEDARAQLWSSLAAQARSGRLSGRAGRRFDSLDAVARAPAIRPSLEMRNEAIACLALADLRVQKEWSQPGQIFFDADLEHYALGDEHGNVSIREVATQREVASLPGLGVSLGIGPHDGYHALLFSPDNELLAVRNRDGAVQVWNWRQHELIFPKAELLANRGAAESPTNIPTFGASARMEFTPDSRSLAVVQADGLLRVFALANGEEQHHFVLAGPPFNFLRFSPTGDKFCLVHADEHVQLHRASDGQLLRTIAASTGGLSVAWEPNGRRLATGGLDSKVHLWDADTGAELASLSGHQSAVSSVAFSHNGKLLVSSGWDSTTRVWDAGSGNELLNLRTGGYCPRFSRDDRRFIRSNPTEDGRPEVYEVAQGNELRTLVMPEESKIAWALHFSPDGRLLASAHVNVIALWESASARQLASFPFPGDEASAVLFSADGRTLFTSGPAGLERRAVQLQTGPSFDTMHIGPPETIGGRVSGRMISLTDDGRLLAVSDNQGARVLNLEDQPRREVMLPTGQNIPISAAISPKGDWIAIGGFGALEIWDARSNVFQCAFPVPMRQLVAFSPDGKWLVSGSGREYQVREVGTWNLLQRLAPNPSSDLLRPMAFSGDGRMLAICLTHDTVQLLNTATWRELATLESSHPTMVSSLSFSPNGTQLAVGSRPPMDQLWDLRLIRRRLAEMNLDWELPPYPPEDRLQQAKPLRVTVDGETPRPN